MMARLPLLAANPTDETLADLRRLRAQGRESLARYQALELRADMLRGLDTMARLGALFIRRSSGRVRLPLEHGRDRARRRHYDWRGVRGR